MWKDEALMTANWVMLESEGPLSVATKAASVDCRHLTCYSEVAEETVQPKRLTCPLTF